jgi:hypothetical protein
MGRSLMDTFAQFALGLVESSAEVYFVGGDSAEIVELGFRIDSVD